MMEKRGMVWESEIRRQMQLRGVQVAVLHYGVLRSGWEDAQATPYPSTPTAR
jgi:hypothetical protein